MSKEETLSDKILTRCYGVPVKDVKEFIQKLKDCCDGNGFVHENKIDELAGDALIHSPTSPPHPKRDRIADTPEVVPTNSVGSSGNHGQQNKTLDEKRERSCNAVTSHESAPHEDKTAGTHSSTLHRMDTPEEKINSGTGTSQTKPASSGTHNPLSRDSVRETRLEGMPKVTRLGRKLKSEDTPDVEESTGTKASSKASGIYGSGNVDCANCGHHYHEGKCRVTYFDPTQTEQEVECPCETTPNPACTNCGHKISVHNSKGCSSCRKNHHKDFPDGRECKQFQPFPMALKYKTTDNQNCTKQKVKVPIKMKSGETIEVDAVRITPKKKVGKYYYDVDENGILSNPSSDNKSYTNQKEVGNGNRK